jgi:hypothetical protein
MRPKLTATTLPDELYIHWRDALISGTLARARSTPGQPWSASPTLDNNMYQYYRSKAKAVVARGYSSAHIRVITRGFGR